MRYKVNMDVKKSSPVKKSLFDSISRVIVYAGYGVAVLNGWMVGTFISNGFAFK